MGQSHLFEEWVEPGVDEEEKKAFFLPGIVMIFASVFIYEGIV